VWFHCSGQLLRQKFLLRPVLRATQASRQAWSEHCFWTKGVRIFRAIASSPKDWVLRAWKSGLWPLSKTHEATIFASSKCYRKALSGPCQRKEGFPSRAQIRGHLSSSYRATCRGHSVWSFQEPNTQVYHSRSSFLCFHWKSWTSRSQQVWLHPLHRARYSLAWCLCGWWVGFAHADTWQPRQLREWTELLLVRWIGLLAWGVCKSSLLGQILEWDRKNRHLRSDCATWPRICCPTCTWFPPLVWFAPPSRAQ